MESISRRSFVTTAAVGMATLGATGTVTPPAQARLVELALDWNLSEFNKLAHHRARVKQLYDVVSPKFEVLTHIRNSLNSLHFGFGIPQDQIQIVAVSRGPGILMNFDDYVWKTYNFGTIFKIDDPKTGKPAERNVFYTSSKVGANFKYSSNDIENPASIYNDTSIYALQQRGVRFLCCHNTIESNADYLAQENHMQQIGKQVYQDLVAHTLPNVLIVPAAVAAVGLLQSEGRYGYIYG
jgi:intracellular sulfur oxidation DsrE/DsrF family protein